MTLIGLMGKAHSGKSTVGAMLVAHHNEGLTIAFADKLKHICMELYGLTHDDVYTEAGKARRTTLPCQQCPSCGSLDCTYVTSTQRWCRSCQFRGEPSAFQTFWTPRMILQHLGTEGTRRIDDQVWVKQALNEAAGCLRKGCPFVVITDCRFRSEVDAIHRAGGEVWRIRRPATDHHAHGMAAHTSETEMDTLPDTLFQAVLTNDATLEVLRAKAEAQLDRVLGASPWPRVRGPH